MAGLFARFVVFAFNSFQLLPDLFKQKIIFAFFYDKNGKKLPAICNRRSRQLSKNVNFDL